MRARNPNDQKTPSAPPESSPRSRSGSRSPPSSSPSRLCQDLSRARRIDRSRSTSSSRARGVKTTSLDCRCFSNFLACEEAVSFFRSFRRSPRARRRRSHRRAGSCREDDRVETSTTDRYGFRRIEESAERCTREGQRAIFDGNERLSS